MLKPRALAPIQKNQLNVPVKRIVFYNDPQRVSTVFRFHEVTRKKLKQKHKGVSAPADCKAHYEDEESNDKETTSSKDSITSLIHIRGRASLTDVTEAASLANASKKTMTSEEEEPKFSPFLTEEPASSKIFQERLPVFYPVLECSKYQIIGEPKFRKKRCQRSVWTLPKITPMRENSELNVGDRCKANAIDLGTIYGAKSKVRKVQVNDKREDTVILPPMDIGNRRHEAEMSVDASSLAEKRLVTESNHQVTASNRQVMREPVAIPVTYKSCFRLRQRQHKIIRSLFATEDTRSERSRQPVHCRPCSHLTPANLHYCDVLGKRFCRFCSQLADRTLPLAFEGSNRLLVVSHNKQSSSLQTMKEPSFIGVRKIIITKTIKEGEGQGHNLDHH